MENEHRIAELERLIKGCIAANISWDEYKVELDRLKDTSTPATAMQSAPSAPVPTDELAFEIIISDPSKFDEGAKYVLNRTGNFRSKIVRIIEPNTEKPQRWFVCETEDSQVPEPNIGVLVGEYGRGSGILRGFLDDLKLKYRWNKDPGILGVFKFTLPYYFSADWGRRDQAIGGVEIKNITVVKPPQAL